MNRRNFLKMLASSVPVAAVAPTYFFAPVGGWPRSEYQRRMDAAQRIIEKWCAEVGSAQNVYYFHPAQRKAAEELMFEGIIHADMGLEPTTYPTYGGIQRSSVTIFKPASGRNKSWS
jgi:hypothetical protein